MSETSKPVVRIIPLGGVDEIGKNITAIECGEDIIVVDCGSIFPSEDMLGIDLVIPDVTYLVQNKDRVRGFFITHGHEDHVGSLPYVLPQVPAPVYGTKLTCALISLKLKEHRVNNIPLNVVRPGDQVQAGCFKVEYIHVNHSIPGACALCITTPAGVILHSGDFKIDFTPVDGRVTDLARLGQIGSQGVLALLCESTNVERKGYTESEKTITRTFESEFRTARGRVIVAMFASNINRLQQVIDCGLRWGRKVCFVGRSMISVTRVAMEIGELTIPADSLCEMDEIDSVPDNEALILTTGSQGEPMSGLTRMAFSEHRKLQIKQSDKIIISANPIPGNEKLVSRVINQLYRCGAEVIYDANNDVHVSGHARQEEIKLMHTLVRPKYFIPVHGEFRHLWQHADLACEMGMPSENIKIPAGGQVIELSEDGAALGEQVPYGEIMIDGLGIGDVGSAVLRDRKHLGQDGLLIVAMAYDRSNNALISGPDIISRGFVYVRESEDILEQTRDVVRSIVLACGRIEVSDWPAIKNRIKDEVHRFIFDKIKRNPMILPVIVDLG